MRTPLPALRRFADGIVAGCPPTPPRHAVPRRFLAYMLPLALFLAGLPQTTTADDTVGETAPPPAMTTPDRPTSDRELRGWPFDAEEAQRRQREAAATWGIPIERIVHLRHGVVMEFVLIPPGSFVMGSPDTEPGHLPDRGESQRRVTLTRPFYMAKYPCTQRQWTIMTGSNPSRFQALGPDIPADMTSWTCVTKGFLPRIQPDAPEGMHFALPTEAQWEYACRAGTATAYAFGDTLTREHANVDNPRQQPTPVGQYSANAWGLHDMHGNVWEWCRDTFHADAYSVTPAVDPLEERPSRHHVLRGGSWRGRPVDARSAIRGRSYTDRPYLYFGFRLILEFDAPPSEAAAMPLQDASSSPPGIPQAPPGNPGTDRARTGNAEASQPSTASARDSTQRATDPQRPAPTPDTITHDKEPAE